MTPLPPIETERLILRPFRQSDLAPFAALNGDPEIMRHFPRTLSRDETAALIERIEATRARDGVCFEAVEEKATGELVGMVGLNAPDFEAHFTPCMEIGWRLARSAWGKGYATEAARARLATAFAPAAEGGLDLDEVVAFTAQDNAPSRAVMARLGMTRDPADDFDHPALALGSPLRRMVLYRIRRAA
ncbi:GNAT family N-acetyltransferase [Albimonas sp. CAU 1670]|uniref:GNAT family N-acetyltransferase n=1 Tax=Albimonas sp. CAU 1670 TaxID=3032599 RepID=UPI0023DAC75A|nr:GNAT family N-acetyltransferase [Albimonas sp. CAU 1670]MDF2235558.1 GNAT family N-acetyltransferase [Albimonas sp. CAU 1670]